MLEDIDKPNVDDTDVADIIKDKYIYNTVDLPSNGALGYDTAIEYRDILVKDEKVLASTTEITFQKVLNGVLKGLLKDQSFYKNLTIHDRDFLILWIWANNYTTIKNIEYKCPACDDHQKYDVDLTKLEIAPLSKDYKTPYMYTLKNGEEVTLRLVTTKDEETAGNFCKSHKGYDESFIMMCLAIGLKTVTTLKDKINYIEENFTGKDMANVRGFHKKFNYGLNDEVEAPCSNCGEVNKIAVPFQVDFFIPTISDDIK